MHPPDHAADHARHELTASVLAGAHVTQGEPALAPHPICDTWPQEAQRAGPADHPFCLIPRPGWAAPTGLT